MMIVTFCETGTERSIEILILKKAFRELSTRLNCRINIPEVNVNSALQTKTNFIENQIDPYIFNFVL
jgi:hypothetical protein